MSELASRVLPERTRAAAAEHERPGAAGELRTRVISDVQSWEALRGCWDDLLVASCDSTPWQSWDYLSSWWRHLGAGKQLRVIVVESARVPVLIFPLQLAREWMIGVPTRILEPISMLWDVNRPRFAIGAHDPAAYARGLQAIWELRHEWDVLRIEELPIDDPQAQDLQHFAAGHGLWFRHVLSSVVPYLSLEQPWEQFLQTRGRRLRKNLRAARRRLESFGPVSLEIAETPEDIRRAYGLMLELHRHSWKRRKRVGLSHSEAYRAFFSDFLSAMARKGQARILTLRAGAQPVAATLAFTHLDTYFSTEIVHHAAFAKCSPGTLLEAMELEHLMSERAFRQYDFLGRFLNNKQRWTEQARITHRIYVFQPGLKTRLLDFHYFRAKPFVKRLWRAMFGPGRATAQAIAFLQRATGR